MSTAALYVRGLAKTFGGLRAVDDVSFTVPHGSLTALIGPNGAGKTTLFNLITNFYRPDAGDVRFYGESLAGVAPGRIAERGLVRTFQSARIFPGMTTLENALVGAHLQVRAGPLAQMLWLGSARREERALFARAEALLELVGLAAQRDSAATDLPMGAQKLLEVVRALMARPRLLLLDEPAAGLNDSETAELAALLRAIRANGITVVLVEHNMSLVMGVADQVVVLDAGTVLASGTPAQMQSDRRVIEAYIGQDAGVN
ncbi:MAG TPA: ABC transporter ATP-binding protein [Rhodocyclaceae bacterium]|nr:ABC transporter ATP-binding protein [Rhodocyclaceae bacterium]